MAQKWKSDPTLFNAPTKKEGLQIKKQLDYDTIYRKEFLDSDPLRDWESIDRCIWLWNWAMSKIDEEDIKEWAVLDCGTKDAQFPSWLREQGIMALGLEYSESYVRYAINKGRPVRYGNVCNMEFDDNQFDFVFSHHLLGLVPDNLIALKEMYRVSKQYMLSLCSIPGNKKKHYSYMKDSEVFDEFVKSVDCEVLYNDYLKETNYKNEWVLFVRKEE